MAHTGFIDMLKDLFTAQTEVTVEYINGIFKQRLLNDVDNRLTSLLTVDDDDVLIPTYVGLKGGNVDVIKLKQFYDVNTIAPEYLQTNYKKIECTGVVSIKDINKSDIIQRWNIIRQSYNEITHYDNETWIKFDTIDDKGRPLILGKSWIASAILVHRTGKTVFTVDDMNPDDIAYMSAMFYRLGRTLSIKQTR